MPLLTPTAARAPAKAAADCLKAAMFGPVVRSSIEDLHNGVHIGLFNRMPTVRQADRTNRSTSVNS